MKEFLKKPLVHYTMVLTIVAIICGALIGSVNAITAPVIEKNRIEAQNKAYQEVLPAGADFVEIEIENLPKTITTIVEGKDAQGKVVGYVYILSGTNQHGSMTIALSLDEKGKILGAQFVAIEQTLNVEGTRNNLSKFVGTKISDLKPEGDLVSGVTNSLNTVKELLSQVAAVHREVANVPLDPYTAIFGPDYTLTTDASFEQTYHVLAREIAKDAGRNDIGYVYKLNGIGVAQDGQAEKELTFYVALDKEQKILGIISPEEEYKHSSGGFRNVTLALMESLVGLSLNDIDTDYDVTGGATNTGQLVIDLLVALKEVAFEEITTDPYAQIFGKDYTKTEDNDFEKTDHILRKEDVVNESNELIGYVYQLRDVVENFKPEEFNPITIYVILDKENKILGILAPEAEYEHTLGERYDKVLGNIELLVGEKLEDIEDGEYDFVSGVTNTTGLVIDLLIELKEVILK